MRVGEAHALEWGDVDEQGSRFRIRQGKTAAARRWVAVPESLIVEIAYTCPREDRTPERKCSPASLRTSPTTSWQVRASTPGSSTGTRTPPPPLRERPDRSRRPGDPGRRPARSLAELTDARHLLPRADRRVRAGSILDRIGRLRVPFSSPWCAPGVIRESASRPQTCALIQTGVHILKTPNSVSEIGAFRAAESPRASTRRVSSGSMIPSSQRRAVE